MRFRFSLLGLLKIEFDYYTNSHWADEPFFPDEDPEDPAREDVPEEEDPSLRVVA